MSLILRLNSLNDSSAVKSLVFLLWMSHRLVLIGISAQNTSIQGGALFEKSHWELSYDIFDRTDVTVAQRSNYVNYMKDNPIIAKRKKVNLKGLI